MNSPTRYTLVIHRLHIPIYIPLKSISPINHVHMGISAVDNFSTVSTDLTLFHIQEGKITDISFGT